MGMEADTLPNSLFNHAIGTFSFGHALNCPRLAWLTMPISNIIRCKDEETILSRRRKVWEHETAAAMTMNSQICYHGCQDVHIGALQHNYFHRHFANGMRTFCPGQLFKHNACLFNTCMPAWRRTLGSVRDGLLKRIA